jgi:hypothetical protein
MRIHVSRIHIAAVLAALLAGAVAVAQEEASSDTSQQPADPTEGMVKARSAFRETWVKPDADFTQYDKLYLWEAVFQYRDVGESPRYRSTLMSSRQSEFAINEADRQKVQEIIGEAFDKEIKRGKRFTIVNEIGPDTMIMRAAVLDIVSRVPPEFIGRSEVYLASIGEATLVMELLDAETGESLAIVAERRPMGRPTGGSIDVTTMPTNNVTIIADLKRWASSAANRLRRELDKAIAGR